MNIILILCEYYKIIHIQIIQILAYKIFYRKFINKLLEKKKD